MSNEVYLLLVLRPKKEESKLEDRLNRALSHPRKPISKTSSRHGEARVLKGSEEYDDFKKKLDDDLDRYQTVDQDVAIMKDRYLEERGFHYYVNEYPNVSIRKLRDDWHDLHYRERDGYALRRQEALARSAKQKLEIEEIMPKGFAQFEKPRRLRIMETHPMLDSSDIRKKIKAEWDSMPHAEKKDFENKADSEKWMILRATKIKVVHPVATLKHSEEDSLWGNNVKAVDALCKKLNEPKPVILDDISARTPEESKQMTDALEKKIMQCAEKPLSAFMHYMRSRKDWYRETFPKFRYAEIRLQVETEWNAMTAAEKAPFELLAKNHLGQSKAIPMRPMSSWMAYGAIRRPQIKVIHPQLAFGDITKQMAAEWNGMSDAQKAPYDLLAKEDKERYKREKAERDARL